MRNLTLLFIFSIACAHGQSLQVMTYNIRYDNPGDGVNQWNNRKQNVFVLLKKYDPDIIGVQEALRHQLTDIAENLKQYEFVGAGRDDGKQKGEHSAIFFRKDRFKILEQQTFWLSQTPSVPGSKNWDAAITRVATWARLQDQRTKKIFVIINTHFDHIGKESRRHSAALLKDSAAAMGRKYPVIITGDFNFTRDKPPYEVMMDASSIRLIDTAPADAPGTACGFAVNERSCTAIDYIFHTEQWSSKNYQVIRDHDGANFPSDHLPVMTTLSLQK
jgi:endonuclease/exonuclease/phosphatase family metal-dependent hydrolase